MSHIRPVIFFSQQWQQAIQQVVQQALQQWQTDWLVETAPARVSILSAEEMQAQQYWACTSAPVCWLGLPQQGDASLLAATGLQLPAAALQSEAEQSWLAELRATLLQPLSQSLLNRLHQTDIQATWQADTDFQPTKSLQSGMPYIALRCQIATLRFDWILHAGLLEALRPQRAPHTPLNLHRHEAVGHAMAPVTVELPEIELSVKDLAKLRVGDVIQSDCPLDGPLNVHLTSKQRTVTALLGQRANRLAVQIQ